MLIFKKYDDEISSLVKEGKVLLHPTDTVWGLAAAYSQKAAIDRIYEIKHREKSKPLILLVDNLERLKSHVLNIHPRLETLLSFHSRPLTIIYDKTRNIPDYLKAEDGTIGIRIVGDEYCQRLIREIDEPLVSTSANLSHESTPLRYEEINDAIINNVDIIFHPHLTKVSKEIKPSVIARLDENEELEFLRD